MVLQMFRAFIVGTHGNLSRKIIKSDPTRNKYGFLPKKATVSKG